MKIKLLIVALMSYFSIFAQTENIFSLSSDLNSYSTIGKYVTTTGTGSYVSNSNVLTNLKDASGNTIISAGLGVDKAGVYYVLKYNNVGLPTSDGNDGSVTVYAFNNSSTGVAVATIDFNGSSTKDLGFVRLAIDASNVGWIIASEMNETNPKIYLASFPATGTIPTNITLLSSTVTTSDNNNAIFQNGDLAFDALGKAYILANDFNNNTAIYLLNTTGDLSSPVLLKKWDLRKDDGSKFQNRVNGTAFGADGSLYVSTDGGLYYIDQMTVNTFGAGTVKCKLIKSTSDLTDLASKYWPNGSRLPIKWGKLFVQRLDSTHIQVAFMIYESNNNRQLNIQISEDQGKSFRTVAVLLPGDVKNETTYSVIINTAKK